MKKIVHILLLFGFLIFSWTVNGDEPSYAKVLKKYHRHGEKYSWETLHENIYWDVVFKSMEFREAYERQYGIFYKLSPQEVATRIEQAREEAERGDEFFVVLTTYSKTWNDLESKDSIWRLRLLSGDESIAPTSITKIKPTPVDTTFYPYVQPWSKVYLVVFPKGSVPAEPSEFKLSLYGVKGQQTLTWNLSK